MVRELPGISFERFVPVTATSAPADVDVASWIRDFLEGVGVVPVRIVAVGEVAEVAAREWRRWYGLSEPDPPEGDCGAMSQCRHD